jgi:hypothetical protein
MPAMIDDVTTPERARVTRSVVHTTLYDLIAAVNEAIEPGEEAYVTPVVAHLLRAGHARFRRDVTEEMLWIEPLPDCLSTENLCVPA